MEGMLQRAIKFFEFILVLLYTFRRVAGEPEDSVVSDEESWPFGRTEIDQGDAAMILQERCTAERLRRIS